LNAPVLLHCGMGWSASAKSRQGKKRRDVRTRQAGTVFSLT
jgi:hypothetical protein